MNTYSLILIDQLLEQKKQLFYIIQQLLQDQFLYGGIASLGGYLDFRLGQRIYNEKYNSIERKINNVLEDSEKKLNKDSSFKFIEYMTENKITVMYIKLEKRNDTGYEVVIKKDNENTPIHFFVDYANQEQYKFAFEDALSKLNIDNERTTFITTMLGYFEAANIILKKYDRKKNHIFFYIIRPSICNKNYNGAAFLTTYSEMNVSDEKLISIYLSGMLTRLTVEAITTEKEKALKSAAKTAKSAIMSRNMSHNLGSHVMAYLKQHLNSVHNIIVDNVLANLVNNDQLFCTTGCKHINHVRSDDYTKKACEQLENVALPFLVGLGKFVSYLQERQDFIATIATDYIPYYSEVNFKDCIYDELNPDLRYKRHLDRSDLETDNILLGNIARSEGLGRLTSPTEKQRTLHDIILRFRNFTGQSVTDLRLYKSEDECLDAQLSLEDMRKYEFSLPGGVVGRQAIFSIIENIIRNAAKHGNWRKCGKNLELSIDIYCKQDFIESRESVNSNTLNRLNKFKSLYDKYYRNSEDIDNLYIITITDNLEIQDDTLEKIQEAIVENYVDAAGKMVNSNKGIKEMRISAAWLRSLEDDPSKDLFSSTNAYSGKAPILLADKIENHLRYTFCVLRPKKIAVISSRKNEIEKINKESLTLATWNIYTFDEYTHPTTNKNFEFILFDVEDEAEDGYSRFNELRSISSNRLYYSNVLGDNIICHLADQEVSSDYYWEIERQLYRYLAKFKDEDIITISDDKVFNKYRNENPIENVKITNGIRKDDLKYLFKKHFDTKEEFFPFIKSYPQGCVFVEGITGNNSTDRLIRNEKIDESWLFKQLHAIKESVAVFDERLFTRIFRLEETNIKEHFYPPITITDKNNVTESSHKTDKSDYLNSDYNSIIYHLKGVDTFNIVKIDNKMFDIYGYGGHTAEGQMVFGKCIKIGQIIQRETSIVVEKQDSNTHFGYISIHQGILDKIYDEFKIKDDKQAKLEFTETFYNTFSETPLNVTSCIQNDKISLPQMYIHSGRSKPSDMDMPQQLPFIQYAAIEHAVLDCKYSLIQLLDSARYE